MTIDETPKTNATGWTTKRTFLAGVVLAAAMIIGVVVAVTLLRDDPEPAGLVFTIPAGSRNLVVPTLESAVPVPTDIRFTSAEEAIITVINEDDVAHRAGPFQVGAKQTYVQRFDKPGTYPIACAVDPADSVVVTVEA